MNNYSYIPIEPVNPPRCECHDCTQARWKSSMQGQLSTAMAVPQTQTIVKVSQ